MSIFDRNMFRQTSAVSPDVTVIGQGGNVMPRPKINIAPPIDTGIGSLNIDAPTFDDINIKEDSFLSDKPTQTEGLGNINTGVRLGPNQIALSDGTILDATPLINKINSRTIDATLVNRLSSQANVEVPMGENVLMALARYFAREGEGAQRREAARIPMFNRVGDYQTVEGVLERLGTINAPQTSSGDLADALENVITRPLTSAIDFTADLFGVGKTPEEQEAFDRFEDERQRLGTTLIDLGSDAEDLQSIKDLTQRQLQELDTRKAINLEIPEISQEQMEDDVSEELPTETIAANTIELQDSVDELPSDVDTQADLERRIKEGQAQAELDKVDRSTLTKKEREDRIRQDLDDTTFELTQEQRNQFLADEDKYIKDLAIADIFGGQQLKDFIGSMGKQLVRTGSFMGIPLGTADFVESETGKRAARAELEGKLAIEQLKQTGKGAEGIKLEPSDYRALTKNIKENVPFLEGNIQSVKLLEKAIDIIEKNPQQATGFRGLIASAFSDVKAAIGRGSIDFENLPPYKQVATIIETIRQKNLQAVLGESGRTISDRDRQIITKVFGDQRSGFASPGELKKLLRQSLAGFKASGKQYKDAIVGDIELLNEDPRYAKQVQVFNTPEYDKYNLDYETLTETLINTKKLLDSDIIDIDL
tara:strand:+ start:1721 stop:3676 length:1956 start_codon:yes stop_codon:yes gene_type:complete